jgi:hypothetical protein
MTTPHLLVCSGCTIASASALACLLLIPNIYHLLRLANKLYNNSETNIPVCFRNGQSLTASKAGSVQLTKEVILSKVLCVPGLNVNLISTSATPWTYKWVIAPDARTLHNWILLCSKETYIMVFTMVPGLAWYRLPRRINKTSCCLTGG